jgi:hypothetical protein
MPFRSASAACTNVSPSPEVGIGPQHTTLRVFLWLLNRDRKITDGRSQHCQNEDQPNRFLESKTAIERLTGLSGKAPFS